MEYNMLQSMADAGKENWTPAVQDLLYTNGFAFAREWISGRQNTFLDWIAAVS